MSEVKSEYKHGGVRVPGPGKKIGAPTRVVGGSGRRVTLYLSEMVIQKLHRIAGGRCSISEVVRDAIQEMDEEKVEKML